MHNSHHPPRIPSGRGPLSSLSVRCAAALCIAGTAISPAIGYAETNTVKLSVAARVASFFRVQTIYQTDNLTITESDVRRGYINISAATQFSVTSNVATGFVVDFYPQTDLFVSAQVTGLQAPAEVGASGGSAHQNGPRGRISLHLLDYRFQLRPDVVPGIYPWPMKISVRTV